MSDATGLGRTDVPRSRAMSTRRRRILAVVALIAVAFGIVPAGTAHAGVGVAPVIINFDDALRGASYSRSMYLTNTDPDLPATFTVEATGAISSWLSVGEADAAPTTEFEVPPDSRLSVKVWLDVPADAANADYSGALVVLGATHEPDEGTAGVQIGGQVQVNVEVTGTERRGGSVVDYQIGRAEVGVDQRFTAVIQNTGNVQMLPEVEVEISRDGTLVDTLSTAGEAWVVRATSSDSVTVEWPTSEAAAGDYEAAFTVVDRAGNEPLPLGDRTVAFRLEPRGTFTRSGELTDLRLITEAALDAPVIVEATFFNSGQIDTTTVLEGRLFRDGELVDVAQSLERTVLEGRTETVNVTFVLDEPGSYEVEGTVNYDGFLTDPMRIGFSVDESGATSEVTDISDTESNDLILIVGGATLLLAGAALGVYWLSRRRDGGEPASADTVMPDAPTTWTAGETTRKESVSVGSAGPSSANGKHPHV